MDSELSLGARRGSSQIARNLTDGEDGFFNKKRYLIHDRDHCTPEIF
jgi:hypothetical protein